MKHTKVFRTTVDVEDVCDFCSDKKRRLLAALRHRFSGRCFGGCYIIDVTEVLKSSACYITRTNSSGGGYIDTEFLALTVVFSKWDILVGVKVVGNQQLLLGTYGEAGASSGSAVVTIHPEGAKTLAVGQVVPVRALACEHTPMQSHAAVYSVLLTCDPAAPVYRLRGSLDTAARVELAPLLDAVETELAARSELVKTRKADLWFFESLLFAYKREGADMGTQSCDTWPEGPVWEGPALASNEPDKGYGLRSILEIVHTVVREDANVSVAGVWTRPLDLYRSSPLVAFVPEVKGRVALPAKWVSPVESSPRVVFAEFLNNVHCFLVATRELVQLYSSEELIDKHFNVWAAMRAAQTRF